MSAPYAELHCHSNFSFLDGASHPDELVVEAARLGLDALALTDHDGFYGVVRFAQAARMVGLAPVFGVELTLTGCSSPTDNPRSAGPRTGTPDPPGTHLVVLARDPEGYASLSRVISEAHLAGGEKGRPSLTLETLSLGDRGHGHWLVLTGCRKGSVPSALAARGPSAADRELDRLICAFGRANVVVELWDHGDPVDTARNDALAQLACRMGVGFVATNNVHYASPARRPLAATLAAVRAAPAVDRARGLAARSCHGRHALGCRTRTSLRPLAGCGGPGCRARDGVHLRPPACRTRSSRLPGAARADRGELAGRARGPRRRREVRPARNRARTRSLGPDRP